MWYTAFLIIIIIPAVCALVGCVLMGPRIGRFTKDGRLIMMPGHSIPLSALGGFILIFGFLACNGAKQVQGQIKQQSCVQGCQLFNYCF